MVSELDTGRCAARMLGSQGGGLWDPLGSQGGGLWDPTSVEEGEWNIPYKGVETWKPLVRFKTLEWKSLKEKPNKDNIY